MPTREEIALQEAADAVGEELRRQELSGVFDDLGIEKSNRAIAEAAVNAYILAFPSPAPVGEAALLARAEAAEAALKPFAKVAAEIGSRGKDDECWCGQNGAVIRYGDLRHAAQQTAAAEAREEGR